MMLIFFRVWTNKLNVYVSCHLTKILYWAKKFFLLSRDRYTIIDENRKCEYFKERTSKLISDGDKANTRDICYELHVFTHMRMYAWTRNAYPVAGILTRVHWHTHHGVRSSIDTWWGIIFLCNTVFPWRTT